MRLSPLKIEGLSAEQQSLQESMKQGVRSFLHGFQSEREDGALIGPFPAMLHFPQFGRPVWDVFMALAEHSTLPKPAHEAAILAVGAKLHSRYELYSHERVAAEAGLLESKIAAMASGQRPSDLNDEEGLAYDMAALLSGGAS